MRLRAGELQTRPIRKFDDRPGTTGGPWQMRPLSRGYVLVRTPDPHDQPAINPRYLAEDTDQRAMIGGLRFLRRLFAAPALASHIIEENVAGRSVQSDDELLDYALDRFDRLPRELLLHDGQSPYVRRR
jgi:choline dehydrogenase